MDDTDTFPELGWYRTADGTLYLETDLEWQANAYSWWRSIAALLVVAAGLGTGAAAAAGVWPSVVLGVAMTVAATVGCAVAHVRCGRWQARLALLRFVRGDDQ